MRISRRAAGWALVVYGLCGLAIVVLGAVVGIDLAGRAERLGTEADVTLAAAAATTRAASESFDSVDVSLTEAQSSADAAADLASEAAGTFRSLAAAMTISVFGAQPLLPIADEFTTTADQTEDLADAIAGVGDSLGETRTDVASIGPELERLGEALERIGADSSEPRPAPPLRLVVVLILAWLMLQGLGAILAGLALLRRPREA